MIRSWLVAGALAAVLGGAARAAAPLEGPKPPTLAPDLALFYSCDIQGRLAPWTAEESAYRGTVGGVARMARLYQKWTEERPTRVIVDVGNAAVAGRQDARAINGFTFRALDRLGCEVVNCGDNEAALPVGQLELIDPDLKLHLISANLVRVGAYQRVRPGYAVVERDRFRIGFIGLLRDDIPRDRLGEGLAVTDAAEALRAALSELKGKTDAIVVLAFMSPEKIYELARRFSQVDVFLGGRATATSAPFEVQDTALIAYLGDQGCTVGRLEARFHRGRRPVAHGQVALLCAETGEDEPMGHLVASFKAAVGAETLPGSDWDPKIPAASSFVGAEVCRICHTKQFYAWQATKHAGAYATLLMKERHADAACLSCHATGLGMPDGFDPAKAAGLRPGAGGAGPEAKKQQIDAQTQAALKTVGCECCHGGSRRHLGVALKDRIRVAAEPQLRTKTAARDCERCHTGARPCLPEGERDPFDMRLYLEKINHWDTGR